MPSRIDSLYKLECINIMRCWSCTLNIWNWNNCLKLLPLKLYSRILSKLNKRLCFLSYWMSKLQLNSLFYSCSWLCYWSNRFSSSNHPDDYDLQYEWKIHEPRWNNCELQCDLSKLYGKPDKMYFMPSQSISFEHNRIMHSYLSFWNMDLCWKLNFTSSMCSLLKQSHAML